MPKRRQGWEPDTHPGHYLITESDDDGVTWVCVEARYKGRLLDNPQTVHDTLVLENRLKNDALRVIGGALPPWFDPEIIAWDMGAIDGKVALTVPGVTDDVLNMLREVASAHFGSDVTVG
jgi:hypothetical protein